MAPEEEEESGGDIPEWVVTFGDMMSLLLTFFIMLVSLSEIKQDEQYQALVAAMRKKFGHNSAASMPPGHHQPRNSRVAKIAAMARSRRLDAMNGGEKVTATEGEQRRVEALPPMQKTGPTFTVYFAAGDAAVSDRSQRTLNDAIEEFQGKQLKIAIEGHADDKEQNPWKTAYRRNRSVMQFLTSHGIDPRRIVLVDAATNLSRQSETIEDSQPASRVELVLLNDRWRNRAGTREERQGRLASEKN